MQTVTEAALARYPGVTYDTALPQGWVDIVKQATGHDVRGHFVWLYENGNVFGRAAPITIEGDIIDRDIRALVTGLGYTGQ